MVADTLKVTSHVGRDLLQSAQLFRHEHSVVWEYVANGLQYKDPGTKPTVVVSIDPKAGKIQIRDNGSGMHFKDLEHYFQMHGENLERKHGRPGRGLFGTGKSAAFGIGNSLTLTTVKDGMRSRVRLTRRDIEARKDGDAIPVETLEKEVQDVVPNGTLVEIEEIFLRTIDISSVIRHIERHIANWPDASVVVNNHECEFAEPDVGREIKFNTKNSEYEKLLGDVTLLIKIAKAPLDEELRGIAILSSGVWHETTLAGCERKPFSEYIFGSFDVPALGNDTSKVPAFDMSRSMKLNPQNEVVADIIRFVGVNVEGVRKQLDREDRERRRGEEQQKLQQQGSKIAELINNHFRDWSAKLKSTLAKSGVGRDLLDAKDRHNVDEANVFGNEFPAVIVDTERAINPPPPPGPEPLPRPPLLRVEPDDDAPNNLGKHGAVDKRKQRTGGFNVVFESIGIHEKRAKYDRETRRIIINLEHPRIAMETSRAGDQSVVEDANFLRLAYEIAFTEYAIVLAQELSTAQFYFDPQDALVELRQTIDDLSKAFAKTTALVGKR